MKKIFTFLFVAILFATTANAQWNWGMNAGQKTKAGVVIDTLNRGDIWWEYDNGAWKNNKYKYPTFTANWHFNSELENTLLTSSVAGELGALRKASTVKGWWIGGYDADGTLIKSGAAQSIDGIGKLQNYAGGGDPVVFANVDAARAYLSEATLFIPGKTATPASVSAVDDVAGVVLALDGIGLPYSNRALAAYPGKYKKTDIRIALNFASDTLKSDVAFTLIPLAPGNDPAVTTTYKVVISIVPRTITANNSYNANNTAVDKTDSIHYGTTGVPYVSDNVAAMKGIRRFEFTNVITATSTSTLADSVRFSVVERTGLPYDSLSCKRVVIAIIGESTGAIIPGNYAPFVGIDNVTLNNAVNIYNTWDAARWTNVDPNATAVDNAKTSTTTVIGKVGQIEVRDAQAAGTIYNITGQKVADFAAGTQSLDVKSGIYMVVEKNQPTQKVIVK
ncbi:MAG: hypothetical protein LBV75_02350 [Paludibacter sp.]|nr:hypothetical protein [Paludibacter sp.]